MAIAEDFLDLLPLFPEETEEAIRLRWDTWANEGLTVEDAEEWVDVREGGFFFIASQPGVREAARTYDLMGTEYPAAIFPLFSWGEYLDDLALGYKVERLAATPAGGIVTFSGDEGTVIGPGTTVGVEAAVEDADVREYEVTEGGTIDASGEIDLPVVAREAGFATRAGAGQVTILLSTVESEGEVTVTNAEPIVGGTDPETDEKLRERLLEVFEGKGPGNIHDYEVWARAYIGVGRVTVIPVWDGPGSVKVIVLTAEGLPVSVEVVEGLQAFLDPVAGKGHGQAPVGHTVTVATATSKDITVSAKVEFEDGFTLDGLGGTTAMEAALLASIAEYVNAVQPGQEIVLQKIVGRLVAFDGVHDVGSVKIDGEAKNLALDDDPAEVGVLDVEASVLTEGSV
jgi:uncharacterized phage protein gp47/JayE